MVLAMHLWQYCTICGAVAGRYQVGVTCHPGCLHRHPWEVIHWHLLPLVLMVLSQGKSVGNLLRSHSRKSVGNFLRSHPRKSVGNFLRGHPNSFYQKQSRSVIHDRRNSLAFCRVSILKFLVRHVMENASQIISLIWGSIKALLSCIRGIQISDHWSR